ncbi:MAG: hypothetical protein AAF717_10320 [Bacteroidota bacterium]
MKKYITQYIPSLLAVTTLLFIGCADADKTFDDIIDNEQRGAVLRTVSIAESEILYDVATSTVLGGNFTVTLEAQDQEDGALLSSVEVFVAFEDETEGGTDNDRDEVMLETIPSSAFSPGEFGLPRTEYTVSAETLQQTLGVTGDQIFGGDRFTVRFELVLTDGRRFSLAQNSGTLTGAFFSSPFRYNVNIVCAPSVPTAGTWSVNTTDTFGDGWNGGELVILLDGTDEITIANVDDGTRPFDESVQDFTFEVPDGTQTISITYTSGDFDGEVLFTITSANGNMVSDEGPDPPVDTELLDFCPNNL